MTYSIISANEIEYRVVYYYPDGHGNADEVEEAR